MHDIERVLVNSCIYIYIGTIFCDVNNLVIY